MSKPIPNNKSLEQWIWDAACAIRGAKDAGKFKDYILPLIFIKRLCDVFDDELRAKIKATTLSEGRNKAKLDNSRVRFYIPITPKNPDDDTWSAIRSLSNNIGQELTRIIREVAASNPRLDDVITRIDYNATTRGEREIDDHQLSNLIEAVSQKRLGLHDVDPDIIGRAYEYLIRKFAENSGKSGGEFFTPPEVGEIMARILNPEPGMQIYDPTCGSAGLLIKCESVLNEKMQSEGKKVFTPLSLYGQEKEPDNWAMARMNMVIHDMEGDIELGNTFDNPKFKDSTGHGVKKFDRSVANPMWNQSDFDEEIYTNDAYHRFPAGNPGGKADWGWVQHIYSSLNEKGRAAVVLDTGAASRGSGNANTNKEKVVRQWFIDHDIIEGVLYLPENLFYNTTAPGIVIFLNKEKQAKLKDKIFLINASHEFVKGDPKNYIDEDKIKNIAETFNSKKEIENFSMFVSKADIADYNISPSRYIHLGGVEEYKPVEEILVELVEVEARAKEADKNLQKVLNDLGFKIV